MFATFQTMMAPSPKRSGNSEATRASPSESINTVDMSNAPSSSSTPPTSIGDAASVSSTEIKPAVEVPSPTQTNTSRGSRTRNKPTTYNLKVLAGTAIHAPRKFAVKEMYDEAQRNRRRTISGDARVDGRTARRGSKARLKKGANRTVSANIDALDLSSPKKITSTFSRQFDFGGSPKRSPKKLKLPEGRALRSTGVEVESITKTLSSLGKRERKTFEGPRKRELLKLLDTKEFAHIDTKPVVHEVWSKGKLVIEEPPRKRKKVEELAAKEPEPEPVLPDTDPLAGQKQLKKYTEKGLYAGQESRDWPVNDTENSKGKPMDFVTFEMNMPMWHGERLLNVGRDFKLPFDVFSPLPPGQPKPADWHKTSTNRFVGDAGARWKHANKDQEASKCVCKAKEGGCGEHCQNKAMSYECDESNCSAGREHCKNRPFTELQERRMAGDRRTAAGKYRTGVEVLDTGDRGFGVRSNRCFEPHQIIVEYTGEIITEEECDRRMNEDYKNNECYYLMAFDQSMIIDATRGSIARFVNHSCDPNCTMVKWLVHGKPRMALFALNKPIMTGDELTYDYNFSPFSSKNVQECRCGSKNCRGVLGPKPKDQKIVKEIKEVVKAGVKATKRKFNELLGGDDEDEDSDFRSPKKRKMKKTTGIKNSTSSAGLKAMKGVASTIKNSVAAQLLSARKAVGLTAETLMMKKSVKTRMLESNGEGQFKVSSKRSSLTIFGADSSPESTKIKRTYKPRKSIAKTASPGSVKIKRTYKPRKSITDNMDPDFVRVKRTYKPRKSITDHTSPDSVKVKRTYKPRKTMTESANASPDSVKVKRTYKPRKSIADNVDPDFVRVKRIYKPRKSLAEKATASPDIVKVKRTYKPRKSMTDNDDPDFVRVKRTYKPRKSLAEKTTASPGPVKVKRAYKPRKSIAKDMVRKEDSGVPEQATRASSHEGMIRDVGSAGEE